MRYIPHSTWLGDFSCHSVGKGSSRLVYADKDKYALASNGNTIRHTEEISLTQSDVLDKHLACWVVVL